MTYTYTNIPKLPTHKQTNLTLSTPPTLSTNINNIQLYIPNFHFLNIHYLHKHDLTYIHFTDFVLQIKAYPNYNTKPTYLPPILININITPLQPTPYWN